MESRLNHATMHFVAYSSWLGVNSKTTYPIFFLLQPVRAAQASFRPYGLKDAVLLSFCISGRKARNAYTSQAVRPEMCVKVDSGRKA